jgi:formate dehydrogenase subunit gamma
MSTRQWEPIEANALVASCVIAGNPLVALQSLQSQYGFVHPEAFDLVAQAFNISRAEVFGIVTYYSDLRTELVNGTQVRVCMGEACQAVGARTLAGELEHFESNHSETHMYVSEVFCMGNCALGPTAVVGATLLGLANVDAIAALLHEDQS